MYEYQAKIVRVIDGDTIAIDVDLGFGIWRCGEVVRLLGINAPEMNTIEGRTAKAYVEQWATEHGAACVIQTVKDKREKYGRLLATIYAGLRCLNDDLVANGHAVKKVY